MEIIEIENLKYAYKSAAGEKIALDYVNLKIFSGEFIAIIGTNGSGKSTLAKHFNAILQPTSGKVLVKNLDTAEEKNLWKIRSEVGMVFQNLDNEIVAEIVEDDIAFGSENLGIEPKESRRHVDLALDTVGVTIILITHFMDEASQADKIFVMEGGRIINLVRQKKFFLTRRKSAPVEFSDRLRRKGYEIPPILTAEELAEHLQGKS